MNQKSILVLTALASLMVGGAIVWFVESIQNHHDNGYVPIVILMDPSGRTAAAGTPVKFFVAAKAGSFNGTLGTQFFYIQDAGNGLFDDLQPNKTYSVDVTGDSEEFTLTRSAVPLPSGQDMKIAWSGIKAGPFTNFSVENKNAMPTVKEATVATTSQQRN